MRFYLAIATLPIRCPTLVNGVPGLISKKHNLPDDTRQAHGAKIPAVKGFRGLIRNEKDFTQAKGCAALGPDGQGPTGPVLSKQGQGRLASNGQYAGIHTNPIARNGPDGLDDRHARRQVSTR